MKYNSQQSGFALLVALVVVGVVISIGIVLLDTSTKQLRLSTNSVDSELAFHAANAGMECARYHRRANDLAIVGNEILGDPAGEDMVDVDCFGDSESAVSATQIISNSDGSAHLYSYDLDWSNGRQCSGIDMLVVSASVFESGLQVTNMDSYIAGYPDSTLDCDPGGQCTVISAKGYNKPCASVGIVGTVQREVLLEF